MSEFWPKSKAIHLVFWSKITYFHVERIWLEIEEWQKGANSGQKVRLYTWYFGQKSPIFMWNEFGWKMKSGKNERILAKK